MYVCMYVFTHSLRTDVILESKSETPIVLCMDVTRSRGGDSKILYDKLVSMCVYVRIYVCMRVCMYVCMHYVCMYVRMYVCMYICCMYVCMYVCMQPMFYGQMLEQGYVAMLSCMSV